VKHPLTIAGLSIVLLAACSSAAQPGAQGTSPRSRNDSVITLDELRAATAGNLYDYIHAYRPRWLERVYARSFRSDQITGVAVFLDNQYYGGPDALRQLLTSSAVEVRFYGPSEAQGQFGPGYLNGVIQVITRTSE
jgi:hypothetical protein